MPHLRLRALLSAATLVIASVAQGHAQAAATLNGSAADADGHPLAGALVRVVSDPAAHSSHPWRYTLIGDALGKFSQEGLAPGAYLVMVFPGGSTSSILRRIELKAGTVQQLDLRLSSSIAAGFTSARGEISMAAQRIASAPQ